MLESVLLTPAQLARRVRALARQFDRDFAGRDLVIVSVLNGTVLFLVDLIRQMRLPLRLDFVGVSSYRGTTASGRLRFTKRLLLDIRGRDVLVLDDVLDTGKTLERVLASLRRRQPRSLKVCVLLEKTVKRRRRVQPDYVGFRIPDCFVVGYGLDFGEQYRNLPLIGVLHRKLQPA